MRKKNYVLLLASVFTALAFFSGCEEDLPYRYESVVLPDTPYNYEEVNAPEIIKGQYQNALQSFGVTNEGATLGRVLFYDNIMSLNNKVACASCHHQENGFADPVALSEGFEKQKTTRNSMSIVNTVTANSFFWDSRETNLDEMVLKPIENHIEMGLEKMDDLEMKIAAVPHYAPLFEKAYGTPEITKERIGESIAMFLRSMVTANSKFDNGIATNHDNLSTQEMAGKALFEGKAQCMMCHGGTDFRGWGEDWANIGLEMNYTDPGLGENNSEMEGVFKVPSLRNVGLTAPYMHDGRFATLEEVVEHYNSGIQSHPNLDYRLGGGSGGPFGIPVFQVQGAQQLGLTSTEKQALIAFLNTLTDESLMTDVRFSDPFQK